jgi:NADH-quinone oxidoreductase subunit H
LQAEAIPTMELGTYVLVSVIKVVLFTFVLLTAVAYTVLLERKLVGRIQNRWGPTRVGPFGLLQPLADGIKFLLKEDLTPPYVNKGLYIAAPIISVTVALTAFSLIPIGDSITLFGVTTPLQVTDVNVALLMILGLTGIGVYGIALAGWSSNSKYPLLGSLRASAQMVSYEIPLGLSLVGVLILAQSFSLREIVLQQAGGFWNWNFFGGFQFVAFFIFLTAAYAETNRTPFDLPEAESELVAGYHTEYSAMKFAMFFMAEYAAMIAASSVAVVMFFGGWHAPLPFLGADHAVSNIFWFAAKVFFFLFLYIWVRGTLPRFRYDQLMAFGWKVLLPAAIVNLIVTAFVVTLRG